MTDVPPTQPSGSNGRLLGRAWSWFNEQSLLVQVATGLVLFLIIGGPTATVIVATKGGRSTPTTSPSPTSTTEQATVVTGVRWLKDLDTVQGTPDPASSFSVGGQPLLYAVGIDAVRGEVKELDYEVAKRYSTFTTTIGVKDGSYGTYTFEILTDGKPQFKHPLQSGQQWAAPSISLTGVDRLSLIVTTADGPLLPGAVGIFANAQLE